MCTGTQAAAAFDIHSLREEWLGRRVARSTGRYPVEHDPIRRWCHMVGDLNPLFLDPEAAANGPYGAVIAPLPLVPYFAGNGPWPRSMEEVGRVKGFTHGIPLPGTNGVNLRTSWEYRTPVRVGDRLHAEARITDLYVKPVRIDPEAVWIETETQFSLQHGEVAVIGRNTVMVHRSPAAVAASR
jgi:acyl dehydratase